MSSSSIAITTADVSNPSEKTTDNYTLIFNVPIDTMKFNGDISADVEVSTKSNNVAIAVGIVTSVVTLISAFISIYIYRKKRSS